MLAEPQRQGDRAALDLPRVEGRDHAADVDHRVGLDRLDQRMRSDHRAAHRIAVPVDVLREGVHDEIGTIVERAVEAAAA